ncbi:MAG TPA: N-acetylmuramoyl-L-alanine amidase [Kribbellaceae bacterium]|nr:N-acetylmuramoyl-L-alanine amidase [Kribbellaceae bacterium]
MAWFPGAIRKEVKRHRTAMARYRGICNHVAVSEAASLFNYFNQSGNPTSHFYVRKDGKVEQYVDTVYVAPCQLDGNETMLSIETQGGVNNPDSEPWTAAQCETLAQLAAWVHKLHGISLKGMPNSLSASTGVGYHRLGIDPWRVPNGELWSNAYGKICPGTGKIAQIPGIITRANQLTTGDDGAMAWTDAQIEEHLANQRKLIQLTEAQEYNATETRKNTSLTATRLDSVANQQLPDLRGDVEEIKKNTTPEAEPEPPKP